MKYIFFLIIITTAYSKTFAITDSIKPPLQRVYFHDKIKEEQRLLDRVDGKQDGLLMVSGNSEINLRVTDALYRKIGELRHGVEENEQLKTNNDKVRYLTYINQVLRSFRISWKARKINPVEFYTLIDVFSKIFKAQLTGENIAPFLQNVSYEVGRINMAIFTEGNGYEQAKAIIYLKFAALHPDGILQSIRGFANEPFADSLIVLASMRNPVQLYSYAQSDTSVEGQLIHRSTNPLVQAVAKLSQTPNALFYFPFLDDILTGKKTIDSLQKYIGDGEKGFDSVGYYKLLVQTEIDYFKRMAPPLKDTPIAMLGANGLREVLQGRALRHFITPINVLHDQNNLSIRMKAIAPLSAKELYYMLIMGENDIYTSSYKHAFNRMLQRMGPKPRGDSLLLSVNFDYFKKFIKLAANYNTLDTFLKTMPAASAKILMKAFVANLDKTGNLEDAVDVADSYSSITDKKLLKTIFSYIVENEQKSIQDDNNNGQVIYGLLKSIFLSIDTTNKIDLATLGIPSIYEVPRKELEDTSGRVIQQVFFFGDDDGKDNFKGFLNSFPSSSWKITTEKEWVEIRSLKGKVLIYANLPLDNDSNLDDTAQVHLNKFLAANDLQPTVVIHRGHSYWLPRTIDRMPSNAKIVVLGSCGGYKNLNEILDICPDAHIISTKEIGKGNINQPILNHLNNVLLSGNPVYWKSMWSSLSRIFSNEGNRTLKESWDDYIPPYKNLGAIFIKAYNKKMEGE